MAQTAIRRLLASPDGREKVELFGPHKGTYGFRLWQRRRKAWRQAGEICQFENYARAVVEAGRQIAWIGRALGPEHGDSRLSYHLELLRGYTFQFAVYVEVKYGDDHHHCSACMAKLAEQDWPGAQHEGYVTRYSIPDGSGRAQWNWIC